MPFVYLEVKCSRHAGPVASHCRFAPMFASARPPCRRPFDVFSDCISAGRCTKFSRLTKSDVHNQLHKGRQRGRFFRAKAQKKIAPDGRPKRVFKLQGCQPGRMVRSKRVFNCRDANQAGWFGQSATQNTEVFTPCRSGRLSLPLRANVRVGPPAMSSSVRRFFFDRVSAVQ